MPLPPISSSSPPISYAADALGCYGNECIDTRNIDALAARGVRFTRMFAAYPVCAPNRGSIATGRYPTIHGLRANGMRLPKSELTMMDVLRENGYRTYGAGKMHFGPQWQFPADGSAIKDPDPSTAYNPQPQPDEFPWYGFDQAALTEDHRTGPYADYLAEHGYNVWDELHSASYPQSSTEPSPFPEEHHQTTWITDRALDFVREERGEQPFFLWVSYVHPHHPFNPPAPYDTLYSADEMPSPVWDADEVAGWPEAYREKFFALGSGHEAVGLCDMSDEEFRHIKAVYYGMVTQIDRNVGRILDELRARGELEKTIIVFNADHGEMLGDHRLLFKGTTYDCITNVPLIICRPGEQDPDGEGGAVRELFANSTDIMPTLLEMAGIAEPEPSPIQGHSLAPAMTDDDYHIRDDAFIENPGERRTIRTADALLTWHGRNTRGELYDLTTDPNCFVNLWEEPAAAGLKSDLLDLLLARMAQNVDPLPAQEGPW